MGDENVTGALVSEVQRLGEVVAGLRRDVADIVIQQARNDSLLRDGNGGHPLMTRMALVEQRMGEQTEAINALRQIIERREQEGQRGRWDLTKTVLGALLAVVSGVLTAVLVK
jgi:hypothetical protein